MSIILDALRRADAERERSRGGVPGVHDQVDLPTPPAAPGEAAPPPSHWPLWGWVLALGVLVLTGAAWWLRTSQAPGAPVAPPTAVAEATPPVSEARPAVAQPAPVAVPAPAPAAQAAVPPSTVPAPAAQPVPPPRLRPAAPALRMESEAPPAAPAAVQGIPLFKDLPPALRNELPALRIGGTMYSDSPGASVLVVNDQLLREGDTVAPGLLLERIGPKSARLRWKSQRFELPY